MSLNLLVMYAYRPPDGKLLDAQIIGEPDWAKVDRFDIEAKPEGDTPVRPGEQTRAMVRSLLEDRFQLKVHRETRDLPVYNLVLTKKGPKLSEDQTPSERQGLISFATQGSELSPLPRGALRMISAPTSTTLTGTAVSMSTLVTLLQSKSDRIITDKTGFARLLDVQLTFSPDLPAPDAGVSDQSAPSLFTAIQDIGLKLESAKAPVEVVVIDRVQRPSEN